MKNTVKKMKAGNAPGEDGSNHCYDEREKKRPTKNISETIQQIFTIRVDKGNF